MKAKLLLCVLPLGWGAVASCSGGGSSIDAGPDVVKDVVIEYYQAETAPPIPAVMDLAAGAQHTCAIVAYGGQYVTYCFGAAAALGGTAQNGIAIAATGLPASDAAASSPNLLTITSSHGAGHTCGIDTIKQVWCWGDDAKGQCGTGTTGGAAPTANVALDYQFGYAKATALSVGSQSTCMVRSVDGKLSCFGDNTGCEEDLYDTNGCSLAATSATPSTDTGAVFRNITLLGQGTLHGCAAASAAPAQVDAGLGSPSLFCWGDNASLESGPKGKAVTTPAANITTPVKVASIAAGDTHTCFVTDAPHQLFCFGKNDVHQASPTLGTTPIDPTTIAPITLPNGITPLTVAVRADETCIADSDGNVWCFGKGHGTNVDEVTGVKDVAKVAMGGAHTCVLGHVTTSKVTDPSAVVCWGDNTNGQASPSGGEAGTGGTITTPTPVSFPQTAP